MFALPIPSLIYDNRKSQIGGIYGKPCGQKELCNYIKMKLIKKINLWSDFNEAYSDLTHFYSNDRHISFGYEKIDSLVKQEMTNV